MTWMNVLRRESNVSRIEAMGVIINNRYMKCTGSEGSVLEDNARDNEVEEARAVNLKDDLTDDREERIEKREQCK